MGQAHVKRWIGDLMPLLSGGTTRWAWKTCAPTGCHSRTPRTGTRFSRRNKTARLTTVVFAATSQDLAGYDFPDLAIYAEFGLPAACRAVREDAAGEELRQDALTAVREWAVRE